MVMSMVVVVVYVINGDVVYGELVVVNTSTCSCTRRRGGVCEASFHFIIVHCLTPHSLLCLVRKISGGSDRGQK